MKYYTISENEVQLYLDVNGNHDFFKLNGGKIYEIDQGQISEMIKHGGWLVDSTDETFRVIADHLGLKPITSPIFKEFKN